MTVDVGTGPGTWVIDVAQTHPTATVIGVDLSPVQTTFYDTPDNAQFEVMDVTEGGLDRFHDSSIDLVHSR